jgi:hypothetical protein
MPLPQLQYAQGVKQTRRRRLVAVSSRVVFGTLAGIKHVLAAQGWQINTAFIERVNLTLRQHVAAVGRRVTTLAEARWGSASNWPCITCTPTSACPMPAYACLYYSLHRPKGRAQPDAGGRVPWQWRRG